MKSFIFIACLVFLTISADARHKRRQSKFLFGPTTTVAPVRPAPAPAPAPVTTVKTTVKPAAAPAPAPAPVTTVKTTVKPAIAPAPAPAQTTLAPKPHPQPEPQYASSHEAGFMNQKQTKLTDIGYSIADAFPTLAAYFLVDFEGEANHNMEPIIMTELEKIQKQVEDYLMEIFPQIEDMIKEYMSFIEPFIPIILSILKDPEAFNTYWPILQPQILPFITQMIAGQ